MNYVQVKNNELVMLSALPDKIRLADGSTRTGLNDMSEAERNIIGVYGYELNPPDHDPETQWRAGPKISFNGTTVTVTYDVIDKTAEELQADVDCLKEPKKQEIADAWRTDIKNVGMPVEGQDFSVDYDVEDALIWGNSLDFIPDEDTEVEIRSVDNTFHVIPRTLYESIPALQKAYYAQQLQKKWSLQKAVDLATTKAQIKEIKWE